MKMFVWSVASSALLTVLPGCGSDSSSSGPPTTAELVASCKKSCNKLVSCLPDSGAGLSTNCDTICTDANFQMGSGGQSSATSCDYAKVKAKLDECATVECSQLRACQAEAAGICRDTSGGTGGSSSGAGGSSSGTGGSTSGGGGGAAGAGSCADCDKANVCCKSLNDPATCDPALFSKASCDTSGPEMAAIIQACAGVASMCH
jgi:uncharacterized membrane protein YgcG